MQYFTASHFHKIYFMAEPIVDVKEPAIKQSAVEPIKKSVVNLKQPDRIIFRLVKENDRTQRTDTPRYPPYLRFPNKDIIVWEYKDEQGEPYTATREIRWLPGEPSIFVDEQEKDGRKIPDNILNNPNNRFEVNDGDISVRPHERTKIYFLEICNRNVDSKHRTGTVEGLFRRYTEEIRIAELQVKQKNQKEAMLKAFDADDALVYFQAIHLNIPILNNVTGASREIEAIRADYQQAAMDTPVEFLKIFNNADLNSKFKLGK